MRLAGAVGAVAGALLLAGCAETRRALGESCLKNTDCLSGICAQLRCDVVPPLTDTRLVSDAAVDGTVAPPLPGADAGLGDGDADAGVAPPVPAGGGVETGSDAPSPRASDADATDVDGSDAGGSDVGEGGAEAGAE